MDGEDRAFFAPVEVNGWAMTGSRRRRLIVQQKVLQPGDSVYLVAAKGRSAQIHLLFAGTGWYPSMTEALNTLVLLSFWAISGGSTLSTATPND